MARRISSPLFVGRSHELGRLSSALDRVSAGQPGLVLVCGEAGVGKTRLLAEFAEITRAAGAVVSRGVCVELAAGGLPYSPIVAALGGLVGCLDGAARDWLAEPARAPLRRLVPELVLPIEPTAPPIEADGRPALFDAACGLVSRASTDRTVFLVIEDLHWADRSTLDLLRYLLTAAPKCRLLIGATVRTDRLSAEMECALAEYGRDPKVDRIDLGRLDWAETGALIEGIVGVAPSVRLLNGIYERSGGNPFFAEELLAAGPDAHVISPGLRQVALGHVQALSAGAQRLVSTVAVAGRSVEHDRLLRVSGLAEDDLLDYLMESVRGNVLVAEPDSECYTFRHALVREVVYEDTLPGARQRLHRAYGACIAAEKPQDPAGLAELAHHLDRGHSMGPAAEAYVAAGVAAAGVSAYPEALGYLERAIELLIAAERKHSDGLSTSDVARVYELAARYAYVTGDPERAVALQETTLRGIDRVAEPELAALCLGGLAEYLWSAGKVERSLGVTGEAANLVAAIAPSKASARVLAVRASILVLARRWPDAIHTARTALAIARRTGAAAEEGRALGSIGACRARKDIESGLAYLSEAIVVSTGAGDAEAVLSHHRAVAAALHRAGDHPRLAEALAQALKAVDDLGGALPIALVLMADLAQTFIDTCEWDRSGALIGRALGLAGKGIEHSEANFAAARLASCRGLPADAISHLEACWPFDQVSIPERHTAVRAEILVNDGCWLEAREQVAAGLAQCRSLTTMILLLEVGFRAEAEIAAIARLHRDGAGLEFAIATARRMAGRVDELANSPGSGPTAWHLYARHLCDAEMSRMLNRRDPAAWRVVIEIAETMEAPYRTIYPRVRLAEALLERSTGLERDGVGASCSSDRAEGAAQLRIAHGLAAGVGARPYVELALSLGARSRIALGEPIVEKLVAKKPALLTAEGELARMGLSPREIEVLAVLTEGRTNRQIAQTLFIVEKTAAVHVSRILDKLGASNRVEAAAAAHRLGLGAFSAGHSLH